ncbi:MAG TPA: PAS domain S-box protein [Acidobacteriota bacterium]|nr:PAS domain S-box protein [Acidobacteriota bacterium]
MKTGKSSDTAEKLDICQMFREFTDEMDEIVYAIDPETYQILFVNKKAEKEFGKKILNRKCYEIFQNLKRPCSFCTNKHLFRKNHTKTRTTGLQNHKNKRWYKCIDKAIEWPRGKFARLGIAIDITEQKNMKDALGESEGQYRNLFENSPEVIYSLSAKDGKITSLNPAFEKITGWSRSEWIGKPFKSIIHPADLPKAMESFHEIIHGKKQIIPMELRILSKSGEYLVGQFIGAPQIENGKIVGEFGTARDITDSKRIEEALRDSEELFHTVVDNSHDCILIADENFRIVYASNETTHLSGYAKEELIGKDFRKFVDENSRGMVVKRYLHRQNGENVPSRYEFKIVCKNCERRDVEAKSTIIRDRHGEVRTIAQLLDITERKRFEKRLSALNMYGQNLNLAKSMEEVYKLTLDAMEKSLGFEFGDIFIIDGKTLCLVAHRGYSKRLSVKFPLDKNKGISVRAVRTGKPVYVPDVRKDEAYVRGGEGILSELAVPIKIEKKILGVLNVESQRLAAFDENDRELLEILASHAAIAITNIKRQKRLSALNAHGKKLNMAGNIEEAYRMTLDAMEKTLGFEFASVFMVQGKMLSLMAHRKYPKQLKVNLPLDGKKGVTVRAVKTGKPVYVSNIRKEKAYVGAGVREMLSELAVPVKAENKILGVLNVESKRLGAFDEEDKKLLEILASHAATAISNLRKQEKLKLISERLTNLMRSSTKIMNAKYMRKRLDVIANAALKFGWRRAVIALRDENLELLERVTAGLTKEEKQLLQKRHASGPTWQERLGSKFEQFKIGEFYYLPWTDPWIREYVHGVPPGTSLDDATTYTGVPSKLSPEEMIDWHPQDMLYAPLRTPEGRIVGTLSMDDPVDGRKPTRESLTPLELFLHQAAITIENAQLIKSLKKARKQLENYADQLEQKVEERTRELGKSQEQLLKAQKFAVIGELAGMVGHDLRNPLTSIAGAQYYLKKRVGSGADSKTKEMLELIGKNIEYSNKIINDLLDYSREIELEIVESTLKSIVKESLSLVEIPENVEVIDLTENKPKIRVDADKIKRAFVNLIKNAVEAMPRGGRLTIKGKTSNGNVEIKFSDTGAGMTKEIQQKLWTPLFTTKARGMGFGLPVCKRFIEAHRGSIIVRSIRGKGTTFTVTFPIEPRVEEGGEKVWVKPLESSSLMMTKT